MRYVEALGVALQLTLLFGFSPVIIAVNGQSTGFPSTDYNRCNIISGQSKASPLRLDCLVAPSDDAYVDNLSPSLTFGDMPILIVQALPSIPTLRDYAYVKFDVANALPSQMTQSHAKPFNASLSMYVEWINFFYNATVQVHSVKNSTWDERSITWNNRPAFDPSFSQIPIRANDTWVQWDLTRMVGEVQNDSEVSFALIPDARSWKNQV